MTVTEGEMQALMAAVNCTVAEKEAELRAVHARLATANMKAVEAHSSLLEMQREHQRRLATKDQYAQEVRSVRATETVDVFLEPAVARDQTVDFAPTLNKHGRGCVWH
jgi:hypothetical protein